MKKYARKMMTEGLRLGLTLLLGSGLATAFAAIIPGPGDVPDMFGIYPNYANSPLPVGICYPHGTTGASPGASGYLTKGGNGTTDQEGTPQGCTSDATCLAYFPSLDESPTSPDGINDPSNDPVCSGWVGGIRKFVDDLPGVDVLQGPNNLGQVITLLKPDPDIGVPYSADTNKGSLPAGVAPFDYYEIAFVEYEEKMHSDLPPVKLRGYVQLATPTNNSGALLPVIKLGSRTFQYLTQPHYAPLIVAAAEKPVRIRFVNLLPPTSSPSQGKIGLPVDLTYMGGGAGPVNSAGNPCDPVASPSCAIYPENRADVHLHGGTTPWISDGTPFQTITPVDEPTTTPAALATGPSKRDVPDMWYDGSANGNYDPIAVCMGLPTCSVPNATTVPGKGANTFFWTNQQSARLMFWHDHALGFTRLNVYKGMAGGYLLTDSYEAGQLSSAGVPTLDTNPIHILPLVIQEKGFVPSNNTDASGNYQPIGFNSSNTYYAKFTNLVGEFPSQLQAQDPTWDPTKWGAPGQLWWPHVYMPNQNLYDPSGVNAMGRWDYAPWMAIPPPPTIAAKQDQPNPYYVGCVPTAGISCEPPMMTATPDAIALVGTTGPGQPGKSWSPSGTPEVMLDTPVINGTAYPRLEVTPDVYRFHILSAANDRFLNLSWFVAARNDNANTALDDRPALLCNGKGGSQTQWSTTGVREKCTEVRMVPFETSQNTKAPFPRHWYTTLGNGIFDGRWGGVPDPKTRGPAWVQIGTEGGLLPKPAVIKNQPVNYDYNKKSGTFGNVKEKALFLAPAERADVVVDFGPFAGHCLILYNDAPAPVPAGDPRNDYFTGNMDSTDTGGAPTTLPGMGPNMRTLMQVCVSESGGAGTPDYVNTDLLNRLNGSLPGLFEIVQEPIIVPQAAYNGIPSNGNNVTNTPGVNLARIGDTQLGPFKPWGGQPQTATYNPTQPLTGTYQFKSVIEGFQPDYGRMNTNLGTQIAPTLITPGILGGTLHRYADPPVDTMALTPYDNQLGQFSVPLTGAAPDGTQIWHVVHLGVDTHPIHFHMFHVQIVNRADITGALTLPDANELGWKDTVRMNPLEDVTVALRPRTLTLPFEIGNSWRLIDPTRPQGATGGMFSTFDPVGNLITVPIANDMVNFGWEYVWHCHILGHEEDDMMHAIPIANPPTAPTNLTATTSGTGQSRQVTLKWDDNSLNETAFVIQKANNSNFNPVANTYIINQPLPTANNPDPNTISQQTISYSQTIGTAGPLSYRVMARNTVGATGGWASANNYPTKSADSEFSNTVTVPAPPPAPTAPTLTTSTTRPVVQTGSTQLTFYFNDQSNNERSFVVQRCVRTTSSVTGCTWATIGSVPGSLANTTGELNYVDNGVAIGSFYAYRVAAENEGGQSTWAQMTSAFRVAGRAPAAPSITSLALASAPATGLTLTFMDNSDNETSFQIERSWSTNNTTWTTETAYSSLASTGTAITGTGARAYADTTVTAGRYYRYRVRAVNAYGQSAWTGYSNTISVPNPLAIPTAVRVACTTTSCTLTWTDNASGETGFECQKITTPTASVKVGANVTSCSFTGLRTRTSYQFRVRAYTTTGNTTANGTWSATVRVTTP